MNSIEVQKESADIGPKAMLLEGTNNSMHCKQPKELQTEKATSRHNKPKKANITEVISQDYVCTYEDTFVLQYITSSPKDKKLVDIGDAFLTKTELECLIHDNEFLNDDVISAYIYCVNAQEHLRYRAGGKVYLENTFISALIKRDGDVEISPADHNQIVKRVNIYLNHDMVFIPINIIRKHWYLAVINAKKREIQVLDSFSAAMDRDDLTTTLWGLQNQLNIASQSEEFHQDHEWQDLNVTTWPVIEQFQEPMQSDSSSCGLFMLNYMEYWTGDMLSDRVTQEDMTKFRQKLAVILFDSELNTVKGSPRYEHIDDKEKISEDVVLQSPAKQIKRSNSSDGTKDRSSICPLSIPIMSTSAHELVGELCKYIMLIDDAECLEKEWVRSSKPYPISLSLKKLQDTLKIDQPMDKDCFNMAVRILACDELQLLRETQFHYMDLTFCTVSDVARDPKRRVKFDVQSLAKLFGTWPQINYNISSCKLILLPYAFLSHFMLFIFDQDAKYVSILDSLPVPAELRNTPVMRYILKFQRISIYLNLALEVAQPGWNDDIYLWRRILPVGVPKNPDRNLSGYFVIDFMRSWNGEELDTPVCIDGYKLRKRFLVNLLKYNENESEDNIPHVVRELLKRIRKLVY